VQKVAIETNNKLTKDHVFASRPESWPILKRGISYWQVCGKWPLNKRQK
jgi:dolichyl-phosphate-mannose--protein O-mannosyl transferase